MIDIEKNTIINGNSLEVLKSLPDNSIDCCVTSPPYYALRDYGCDGQIGLEETPERYIQMLCDVFSEVRRILAPEGTLWLNIADSYWGGGAGEMPNLTSIAAIFKKAAKVLTAVCHYLLVKVRLASINQKTL